MNNETHEISLWHLVGKKQGQGLTECIFFEITFSPFAIMQ